MTCLSAVPIVNALHEWTEPNSIEVYPFLPHDIVSIITAQVLQHNREKWQLKQRYEDIKRVCPVRPILEWGDHFHRNYKRLMKYKYKRQYIDTRIHLRNMTFDYWNDLYDEGQNPTATPHHELDLRMMNQQWHEIHEIPPGTDRDI